MRADFLRQLRRLPRRQPPYAANIAARLALPNAARRRERYDAEGIKMLLPPDATAQCRCRRHDVAATYAGAYVDICYFFTLCHAFA